jgi:hypothetical protein
MLHNFHDFKLFVFDADLRANKFFEKFLTELEVEN